MTQKKKNMFMSHNANLFKLLFLVFCMLKQKRLSQEEIIREREKFFKKVRKWRGGFAGIENYAIASDGTILAKNSSYDDSDLVRGMQETSYREEPDTSMDSGKSYQQIN